MLVNDTDKELHQPVEQWYCDLFFNALCIYAFLVLQDVRSHQYACPTIYLIAFIQFRIIQANGSNHQTMHYFQFDLSDPIDVAKCEQLKEWKTAPDLETLFALNQSFIRGELIIHPAHGRPLYPESKAMVQSLLRMNEYGMFTFQGQPHTEGEIIPPHEHGIEDFLIIDPTDTEAWCRCCAVACDAEHSRWTEVRLLPFVQFCLPVDQSKTATVDQAMQFARTLLNDPRLHTMISWPEGLKLPDEDLPLARVDMREAAKYISQSDLGLYWHSKSKHGSSCAHEIKIAASKGELGEAEWKTARKKWSEVNDYHLLRPRVPKLFLGPFSKTIVFGVNAIRFDGGVKDLEGLLIETAQQCGFPQSFGCT